MNTLCLENYGVSQMETREMKTTEGGGGKFKLFKEAAKALWSAIIATDIANEFRDGFNEGNSGDCC